MKQFKNRKLKITESIKNLQLKWLAVQKVISPKKFVVIYKDGVSVKFITNGTQEEGLDLANELCDDTSSYRTKVMGVTN